MARDNGIDPKIFAERQQAYQKMFAVIEEQKRKERLEQKIEKELKEKVEWLQIRTRDLLTEKQIQGIRKGIEAEYGYTNIETHPNIEVIEPEEDDDIVIASESDIDIDIDLFNQQQDAIEQEDANKNVDAIVAEIRDKLYKLNQDLEEQHQSLDDINKQLKGLREDDERVSPLFNQKYHVEEVIACIYSITGYIESMVQPESTPHDTLFAKDLLYDFIETLNDKKEALEQSRIPIHHQDIELERQPDVNNPQQGNRPGDGGGNPGGNPDDNHPHPDGNNHSVKWILGVAAVLTLMAVGGAVAVKYDINIKDSVIDKLMIMVEKASSAIGRG